MHDLNSPTRLLAFVTVRKADITDPRTVARARDCAARWTDARQRAEAARAECVDWIRRLHAGGAAVPEIADALGLDARAVTRAISSTAIEPTPSGPTCDLCNARASAGEPLIAGPGARVCRRCVEEAGELIAAGRGAARPGGNLAFVPYASTVNCSFCGRPAGAAAALLSGRDARICDQCITFCAGLVHRNRRSRR